MSTPLFICRRCAARPLLRTHRQASASFISTSQPRLYSTNDGATAKSEGNAPTSMPPPAKEEEKEKELGPMSRRLQEATEEALFTGGRAGRKAIEEAGFDEELKNRLFNKIADASFRQEHGSAIASAGLNPTSMTPHAGGPGTRDMAAAQPWAGEEATADTVLRMLHDAQKPLPPSLRAKPTIPDPVVVDMRLRRQSSQSPGQRAASARDKANAYAGEKGLADSRGRTEQEREAYRKELRDRFSPGFRAMPNSISGLAAMANERIEDAIARGQFRNIPRGPGVERDTRADNPFIDTTEYIMNKMIQRQEIVPPWIEKQQDVTRTARHFRVRLRNDWRRHAARTIASRGGTLAQQMARAEQYARAEQVHNPKRRSVDQMSVPTNATDDPVMVKMRHVQGAAQASATTATTATTTESSTAAADQPVGLPFRDAQWEASERSYMELAINNLNALRRSYNLMAPELAKKPYFSLDRELKACFADVAPELATVIKDRAAHASGPSQVITEAMGRRVLNRFVGEGSAGAAKVYDSKKPHYGLKEMWKDWWKKSD